MRGGMGTATAYFNSLSLAWRQFWLRRAPRCELRDCIGSRSLWLRVRGQSRRVMIAGAWYCLDGCLERVLSEALRRNLSAVKRRTGPHRVPLGLQLLSRDQLTAEQLRAALAAQRAAGRGRIGEWLQALGFVTEQQVTAALARQWSCPVLLGENLAPQPARTFEIPGTLLEAFAIVPVDYVAATRTLFIAFSEGIDYSVLYAIEQMLGCRTEPCLAVPSHLRCSLQALVAHGGESDLVFDRTADVAELARIVRSYCLRVSASEIRVATCGARIWVRLLRPGRRPLDLLFRLACEAASPAFPPNHGHCADGPSSLPHPPISPAMGESI